tara:strand:+ start:807 stop:1358 length:552 start_codon:yes stop_codon:yes gene_type:complete
MDPITAALLINLGVKVTTGTFDLISANKSRELLQDAEDAAGEAVEAALEQAKVNAQRMRTIDPSLYEQAKEEVSRDLSTVLDVAAGEDPRLTAALGTKLFQQSQEQRQKIEREKRKDIQDLEKDIAEEEQAIAKRIADIELERAKGAQLAAAQYEQQRVAQQQRAAGAFGLAGAELAGFMVTQ